MSAPVVRGPRDVPALRLWMLREWFPPGAFALGAGAHTVGRNATEDEAETIVLWNLRELTDADLWWVDADMCDLIEESSKTLPPVSLHAELVPRMPVLAVFEKPMSGIDADVPEHTVYVDALMWGAGHLRKGGPCVSTTIYNRMSFDDGIGARLFENPSVIELSGREAQKKREEAFDTGHGPGVMLHGEIWVPLGRTDWSYGHDWSTSPAVDDPDAAELLRATGLMESQAEDRRWLATLWALAQQPKIATRTLDRGHRGERREAERKGHPPTDVTVVSLRKTMRKADAPKPAASGREYHVRWPVVGHWRNQPYGPRRHLRRPTWIAEHLAGPEGKPLKKGATVKVLR